jgi:DNA processing protein
MSMFGLKEAEVAPLVRALCGDELDREAIEERVARAAWTVIAEPGDGVAGEIIGRLGPRTALTSLVDRWEVERLSAALGGTVGERDLALARDRWSPRVDSTAAIAALRHAVRLGLTLATPDDALWPAGLDDLERHAPAALWIRGRADVLRSVAGSAAIVGARAATGYGEYLATEWVAGLCDRGVAIVSGAAYGIDGIAHRAALASDGVTVAVLAGGVDRPYPSGHEELIGRIAANGCVVSELPCGSAPTRWRFLQRNRIIAAMSAATIVIEAGWRSGSLNTAGHATALGRPVGAAPGPVTSAASAGCHRLVREYGAALLTGVRDVLELLPGHSEVDGPADDPATAGGELARPDPRATRVLDALSSRMPREPAEIATRSGLSVADVRAVLGLLSIDGLIRDTGRGWIRASHSG